MSSTEFDESVVLNERSYANDDFVVNDQLFVQGATATETLQVKNNVKVKSGLAVDGNSKFLGTPIAPDFMPTEDQHLATMKYVNESIANTNDRVVSFVTELTDTISAYNSGIENGQSVESAIFLAIKQLEDSELPEDLNGVLEKLFYSITKFSELT